MQMPNDNIAAIIFAKSNDIVVILGDSSIKLNYWKSEEITGNQKKSLKIIGNHRKSLEIIGNH